VSPLEIKVTKQSLISERCLHNLNVQWRRDFGKPLNGLYENCSKYFCSGKDREENPCPGFISLGEIVEGVCAHRINARKLLRQGIGLNNPQNFCLNYCEAGYRDSLCNCRGYVEIGEHLQVEDILIPHIIGDREIKPVIDLLHHHFSLFQHSH